MLDLWTERSRECVYSIRYPIIRCLLVVTARNFVKILYGTFNSLSFGSSQVSTLSHTPPTTSTSTSTDTIVQWQHDRPQDMGFLCRPSDLKPHDCESGIGAVSSVYLRLLRNSQLESESEHEVHLLLSFFAHLLLFFLFLFLPFSLMWGLDNTTLIIDMFSCSPLSYAPCKLPSS